MTTSRHTASGDRRAHSCTSTVNGQMLKARVIVWLWIISGAAAVPLSAQVLPKSSSATLNGAVTGRIVHPVRMDVYFVKLLSPYFDRNLPNVNTNRTGSETDSSIFYIIAAKNYEVRLQMSFAHSAPTEPSSPIFYRGTSFRNEVTEGVSSRGSNASPSVTGEGLVEIDTKHEDILLITLSYN